MTGETLQQIGYTEEIVPPYVAVKEAVFPFSKFREFDPILGPGMRSTGEVMGIADSFGSAFAKAQIAADNGLPTCGAIFITVNDSDKSDCDPHCPPVPRDSDSVCSRPRHAQYLRGHGIPSEKVLKVHEGRPHAIDLIVNRDVQLLINTPLGKHAHRDDYSLRQAAIDHHVPYTTTMSAAKRRRDAIIALRSRHPAVQSLQEWQRWPQAATV